MKTTGTVLAILLLAAFVAGIIFGIMGGYKLLTTRWGLLSDEWKAGMIILSAILIFCTLFLSSSIRSQMQKRGLTGTGKVMTYNEFIRWYSELKNQSANAVDFNSFRSVRNQLILWGSPQVVKQTHGLVEVLKNDSDKSNQVMTQAEKVFGEIKRELGYRSRRQKRDVL